MSELTDAEIDADLVGDGGRYYAPNDSYPEYGNGTVRWAYRLGVEEGASAVPALVAAVERVQAQRAQIAELLGVVLPYTVVNDRTRVALMRLFQIHDEITALETP